MSGLAHVPAPAFLPAPTVEPPPEIISEVARRDPAGGEQSDRGVLPDRSGLPDASNTRSRTPRGPEVPPRLPTGRHTGELAEADGSAVARSSTTRKARLAAELACGRPEAAPLQTAEMPTRR